MSDPAFAVRAARATETVSLHDLWLAAADRTDWAPAEGADAPLLAELDVLVADRRVWAAFDPAGDPIGVAAIGEVDSVLFLAAFGVAQPARGNGIGRALLMPIVDFGRSAQYPALVAVTRRHGTGSAFLRQCGFVDLAGDRLSPGLAAIVAGDGPGGRRIALARRL